MFLLDLCRRMLPGLGRFCRVFIPAVGSRSWCLHDRDGAVLDVPGNVLVLGIHGREAELAAFGEGGVPVHLGKIGLVDEFAGSNGSGARAFAHGQHGTGDGLAIAVHDVVDFHGFGHLAVLAGEDLCFQRMGCLVVRNVHTLAIVAVVGLVRHFRDVDGLLRSVGQRVTILVHGDEADGATAVGAGVPQQVLEVGLPDEVAAIGCGDFRGGDTALVERQG